MSDPKDFNNDDLLDLDDNLIDEIGEDLDQLYEDEALPDFDGDDLDDTVDEPIATAKSKGSGEGFWLGFTILAFLLALASALLLSPSVGVQEQRADLAVEAVSRVNLAANTLFGNEVHNQSVQELWAGYKAASDQFLANRQDVEQAKTRVNNLNTVLSKTVTDSVAFVEAVAKEGRNKNTSNSKDKYLFLTSEASNLNGILSRLGTSVNGYFNTNTNLSQLADAQNGLMVRLQETLNRIVSNSGQRRN